MHHTMHVLDAPGAIFKVPRERYHFQGTTGRVPFAECNLHFAGHYWVGYNPGGGILHRCKKRFYVFFIISYKKRVLNFFLFLERFLFSSGEFFYPTKPAKILLNLLNFSVKRLLSDGFNIAVIKILS